MSSVDVGGQQLALTRPADLAARVFAATGCSPAELAAFIGRPDPTPALVSRALFLLLEEPGDYSVAGIGELLPQGEALEPIAAMAVELLGSEEEAHHG